MAKEELTNQNIILHILHLNFDLDCNLLLLLFQNWHFLQIGDEILIHITVWVIDHSDYGIEWKNIMSGRVFYISSPSWASELVYSW